MFSQTGKGLGKNPQAMYELREWDNLDEYLMYARDHRDPDGGSGWPHMSGYHHIQGGFQAAWDAAYSGWDTVRPQVDRTLDAVRERLQDMVTPVLVRVHDMIGFEPDIDRYVAGEIECMWDEMVVETPHAGKVFTVLLDNCVSASQNADEMVKRGAAVIALIEAFQMFGFELEIWVETTVARMRGGSDYHSTLVRIARAGDRPDINAIMFPLACPDWHRRLIFASQEGEPTSVRRTFAFGVDDTSYGLARSGAHFGQRVNASIEISLERPDGRMVEDPTAFIVDQLIAQGVIEDDDQ